MKVLCCDADLLVVVGSEDRTMVDIVRDVANSCFIYEEGCGTGRGVAGAVEKEGVLLAAKSGPAGARKVTRQSAGAADPA